MTKVSFKTSEFMGCYFAVISNESVEITFSVTPGFEAGKFSRPQSVNVNQKISSDIKDFEAHAKLVNEAYAKAVIIKKAIDYSPFVLVSDDKADMILAMNCIVIDLELTCGD